MRRPAPRPDPSPDAALAPVFDEAALLRHQGFLTAIARGLLDEHRAADAVQETWLAALRRPPSRVDSARAWLAQVVRNAARTARERDGARTARERRAARPEGQAAPDAESGFELQHRIAAALHALAEPYRTTIYLRYWRDLAPAEIARTQDVPVETVKTRLKRGLELLRSSLDGHYGPTAWRALLAAWIRPSPLPIQPGATTAPGAVLLQGVLAMKATVSILGGAAALAAVVLAVRLLGPPPEPEHAEPAATLTAGPVDPGGPAALEPSSDDPGDAPTSPRAPVAAPRDPSEVASPDAPRTARLRTVDAAGRPLAGVDAALVATDERPLAPPARTGVDGAAELALPPLDPPAQDATLELSAPGFLALRRPVHVADGPRVDLGTIEMIAASALSGTVVDEHGAGVAGATVTLARPGERFWTELPGTDVDGRPHARTDAFGAFELGGLGAGPTRVWAAAPGFESGASAPRVLRAGETVANVVVSLQPAPGADEIAGFVDPPEGVDPAALIVCWSRSSEEGRRTRTASVGDDGRFRVRLERPVPHDLWVQESLGGWDERRHVWTGEMRLAGHRSRVAHDVPAGTSDLRLDFEPAPTFDVEVLDGAGDPIERFTLGVISFSGEDLRQEFPWYREVESPDGFASVDVPATGFYVTASADGHDSEARGPFSPDATPGPQVFELRRLPPVTGTVTAGGEPVPGATVELYLGARSDQHIVSRGRHVRMNTALAGQAETDERGVYRMTVRRPGSYHLLALAPGRALAEVGPLVIDPDRGAEGIDLELELGGAIEGRLLLPPGEDPSGWTVGASRGDPHPRSFSVAADGRFRFEGLTPGEWRIERTDDYDASTTIRSSEQPVTWSGNCVVRSGETVRLDLDLSATRLCTLQGRISAPALRQAVWAASLGRGERLGEMSEEEVDQASVDAEGAFQLVAPEPGRYLLLLRTADLETGGLVVVRPLRLEAPLGAWSERIDVGELVCELPPGALPDGARLVFLIEEEGRVTGTPLLPRGDGTVGSVNAPAGAGTIRYAAPDAADRLPTEWAALGTVRVERGETARFRAEPPGE